MQKQASDLNFRMTKSMQIESSFPSLGATNKIDELESVGKYAVNLNSYIISSIFNCHCQHFRK